NEGPGDAGKAQARPGRHGVPASPGQHEHGRIAVPVVPFLPAGVAVLRVDRDRVAVRHRSPPGVPYRRAGRADGRRIRLFPWKAAFKYIADGIIYAIITGLTFAWLWPAA